MKIEFTRAEVEAILVDHANYLTRRTDLLVQTTTKKFNCVEAGGYRTMPDTFTVSMKEEDAAQ
jgi:hypothetical protein